MVCYYRVRTENVFVAFFGVYLEYRPFRGADLRILIADDDTQLLQQLKKVLEAQFYTVTTARDGQESLRAISQSAFDLVVLDIMMPNVDGLSFLRAIRGESVDVPVLLLSARGATEDRVKGLDLGADDYLAKPFSIDELLARIRALLRRKNSQADSLLKAGDICLDTNARTVTKSGEPVELTPREFAILEFLLYNKNRVVTRYSLAEHVWTDEFDPFSMSNFMDVHIKNLRRKIDGSARDGIIETVRGMGYMISER